MASDIRIPFHNINRTLISTVKKFTINSNLPNIAYDNKPLCHVDSAYNESQNFLSEVVG